jgi:hypothetical protein
MRSRLRFRPRPAVLPDRGPRPERVLLGLAVGLLVLVIGLGPAEATARTTPTSVAQTAATVAPPSTSAVAAEPLVADDTGAGPTGLGLAAAVALGILAVMGGLAWLLRPRLGTAAPNRSPSPASGA